MLLLQQGQNLGMYVSMHRGNFQIMGAGIKRKSNVRTRKEAETCVSDDVRVKESEPKREELSPWRLEQK